MNSSSLPSSCRVTTWVSHILSNSVLGSIPVPFLVSLPCEIEEAIALSSDPVRIIGHGLIGSHEAKIEVLPEPVRMHRKARAAEVVMIGDGAFSLGLRHG